MFFYTSEFLTMLNNNGDITLLKDNEIKKLYRYYIYLFKPVSWQLYKMYYKFKKRIKANK